MNITVYCGSSPGNNPEIIEKAKELGLLIAKNGHTLVYGGSSIGIMGILADSIMINGGEVIGVIPEILYRKEVAHEGITRLKVVRDMHERKTHMAKLGDGFLALPGGFGTFEELFEIITWNQLGIFEKPVVVLNTGGFYKQLLSFIDNAAETGFIKPYNRKILMAGNTPSECLELLTGYKNQKITGS